MNGDRQIDFDDIQPFTLALKDETEFESQFGVPALVRGDLDRDGDMDFDDVFGMIAIFRSNAVQATPEPTSGMLAIGGILTLGLASVWRGDRGRR